MFDIINTTTEDNENIKKFDK